MGRESGTDVKQDGHVWSSVVLVWGSSDCMWAGVTVCVFVQPYRGETGRDSGDQERVRERDIRTQVRLHHK